MKKLIKNVRRRLMPSWTDQWPAVLDKTKTVSTIQLGSGLAKLEGIVNVDLNPRTRPEVVCDLDRTPYPFASNTFRLVIALSVLEHLQNFFAVMGEIHRISQPGASVYILTPHFSDAAAFVDPTHYQHFSARSFDYFIEGSTVEGKYGFYVPYRYRLIRRLIELPGLLTTLSSYAGLLSTTLSFGRPTCATSFGATVYFWS